MTGSADLDADVVAMVVDAAGATAMVDTQVVQRLWSGYGQIVRCTLDSGMLPSVIVKLVRRPERREHPHGWTSDISHERKLASYRIEMAWYERYAPRCPDPCRVPRCLAIEARGDDVVIVLEDLDASGFAGRRSSAGHLEMEACLAWLAAFHAAFMGMRPEGLWETGTYWHLATRPDELDALADGPLKAAAPILDQRLAASPFQTFVHGDAKLANFCFDDEGRRVAAVDFQYVGGGCGMKDLAYFIGSCFDEDDCERLAPALVDRYFALLREALERSGTRIDIAALEEDWRGLYAVAWTDFSRFLQGWSPGHWKLHGYSERLAREVLESL